jgi:hypothetical protein
MSRRGTSVTVPMHCDRLAVDAPVIASRENQPPAKAIEWVSDRIAQRDASEPATSPARTRRPTSHKPTTSRHFSELLAVLVALRSPSDAIEER